MAGKKWRRRLAVVKLESTYGEGSADMTDATILEVMMLEGGNPYDGNTVERERMRQGLGAFEQINTGPHVTRSIRVPYAGNTDPGEAPPYAPLLRACGLSETSGSGETVYQPVSTGEESAELWWIEEGQVQHITGVRGTLQIGSDSQSLPFIEFSLTGLYEKTKAGGDAGDADEADQAKELPVNKQNTVASIAGHAACMASFNLEMGNTVEYRGLVNCESIQITDRQTTGSTNVEAPDIGTKDYFELVESHNGVTLAPVTLTHKDASYNEIELAGSKVQISTLSPTENQGIMHYDLGLRFLPDGSADDDFTLTFRDATPDP